MIMRVAMSSAFSRERILVNTVQSFPSTLRTERAAIIVFFVIPSTFSDDDASLLPAGIDVVHFFGDLVSTFHGRRHFPDPLASDDSLSLAPSLELKNSREGK
ncbi:MAG: hypothetical protein UY72_C0040G0005 [Candidatus Uhrbacteria bacterium GW2011_GWD2_52_7]|uniref:Uncharacterized protein n=1 Tax=Candidatus Uhrbacteria bacterium GW2011_GWD2_52_7 TaxID=1618989 RepID=A0A0G1XE51_9BACT|nr:MAG: hypothetical protein UY72_C0040G0005 [Candidatus Uhrbacteria bacterium GW2011_GWD2_52_7]